MSLLYTRHETDHEIIITFTRGWVPYVVLSLGLIVYVVSSWMGLPIFDLVGALVTFAGAFLSLIGFWKPNKEIRKAMQRGQVQFTGSKLSWKHPLRVTIKKSFPAQGQSEKES